MALCPTCNSQQLSKQKHLILVKRLLLSYTGKKLLRVTSRTECYLLPNIWHLPAHCYSLMHIVFWWWPTHFFFFKIWLSKALFRKIILIGITDDILVWVCIPKHLSVLHLGGFGVQTHTSLSSIVPWTMCFRVESNHSHTRLILRSLFQKLSQFEQHSKMQKDLHNSKERN